MTAGESPGKPRDQDVVRRSGLRRLVADIAPLRTSRDFRVLFARRTVTLFGSQASEVALLVQARQRQLRSRKASSIARWKVG